MLVLAPCPRTSRALAAAGRRSSAETSPFSGVATNFRDVDPSDGSLFIFARGANLGGRGSCRAGVTRSVHATLGSAGASPSRVRIYSRPMGRPASFHRLPEAEADAVRLLGEEDAVALAAVLIDAQRGRLDAAGLQL